MTFRKIRFNITFKLTLVVLLTGLIFVLVFVGFAYYEATSNLAKEKEQIDQNIIHDFQAMIEQDSKTLSSNLITFSANEAIKEAFINKNKDLLYELSEPIFRENRDRFDITHMYFIDLEGNVYLRVHQKDKFGDLVERQTYLKAKENGDLVTGLDLGQTAFALRAVMPYKINGSTIGYIELGQEIDNFVDKLASKTNYQFAVVGCKREMDKDSWESVMAGENLNWDDYGRFVLVTKNTTKDIYQKCLENFPTDFPNNTSSYYEHEEEGKNHFCSAVPIESVNGETIGALVSDSNISQETEDFNQVICGAIIFSGLSYLFISIFIFVFIRAIIITPIKKLGVVFSKIAEGKTKEKAEVKRRDEIGVIAEKFNQMQDKILNYQHNLEENVKVKTEELREKVALAEEQEEFLDLAVRGTELGTWDWDIKVDKIKINDRWAGMVGYKISELEPITMKTWVKLMEPEDYKTAGKLLEEYFAGKSERYTCEFRMKHKNGSDIWILGQGKIFQRNEKGEPVRMCGTHLDITNQKNQEEELKKYMLAVEGASDHIVITSPEGIILYANKAVERITGYAPGETIGQKAGSIKLWGGIMNISVYQELWKTIKEDKKSYQGVFDNVRKDGQAYKAAANVTPILDSKGQVIYFLGIERDITEEIESSRNTQRLASIVENTTDAIYGEDLSSLVTSWNKGAEILYGYTAKEMIGRPIKAIYPEERLGELDNIMETIKRGKNILTFETVRKRKDDSQVDVAITGAPIRDNKGDVSGFSIIARDISKEKGVERAKDEFVSLASHQLRTPATGVKQFIGMLLEGYAGKMTKEQQELVQDAYDSNERQIRIIQDLLEVARFEAGKTIFEPSEFDLVKMIENVILEQEELFRDKDQKLIFKKAQGPVMVFADENKIRMVIDNLVNNANKYTQAGGKIEISIEKEKKKTTVSVSDNGIGISEKDQKELFQRFHRVHTKNAKNVEGTGLGLYIAKKFVEMNKGKITVESKIAKGTKFSIILPKKGKE